MCKKLLSTIFLAALLILTSLIPALAAPLDYKKAELNNVKCLIDGREVYINAYNIKGNNYFRARDICKELDYSVKWNDIVKTIWIRTNEPYIYEEEKETHLVATSNVAVEKQWIYINDGTEEVSFCNIGGYNYFMLRELQWLCELSMYIKKSDKYFTVGWEEESGSIVINSMIADNDIKIPSNNQPSSPTVLPPSTENNGTASEEKTYTAEEFQDEVLRLVNIEREKVGVDPLEADPLLMEIAMLKAKEMVELNYFSHESPTYGNPTEFAKHYGYDKGVGENITENGYSPTTIMNIWMDSDGHRKNILNPDYKYLGVGFCTNEVQSKSLQMFSRND